MHQSRVAHTSRCVGNSIVIYKFVSDTNVQPTIASGALDPP